MKSKYQLWKEYNPTYFEIQCRPALRRAMKNDPGVKFMRRGWLIVLLIIMAYSIIFRLCT